MKNYYPPNDSPANRFRLFCEERGLKCEPVPCSGRSDRVHAKKLLVEGRLCRVRKLNQADFYYKLHPTKAVADFVVYKVPDTDEWLVLPVELTTKSTMFSLSPDLDRATRTQRHSWGRYVNNLEQFQSQQKQ